MPLPYNIIFYLKIRNFPKSVFTFPAKWCMMPLNRVGGFALSATGTGSCPEDEGSYFCDEAAAPAASYGTNLLYVATILGRANGRLVFAALSHW